MGLTRRSVGGGAADNGLDVVKHDPSDRVIALAGNPNVGKSTVFNALTGMKQHTGNWPGKTVTGAWGRCEHGGRGYCLVDIPGTYSLMAHSAEEEVARNYVCFGSPDATVVVCDATCLERNLNLVLQVLEVSGRTVVCVNLLDEAERKGMTLDLELLVQRLGVPVVGVVARRRRSLDALLEAVERVTSPDYPSDSLRVRYPNVIEHAIEDLELLLEERFGDKLPARWLALRLIEGDEGLVAEADKLLGVKLFDDPDVADEVRHARDELAAAGIDGERFKDILVASLVTAAETACDGVVTRKEGGYSAIDRKLDRILTSKRTGYPIMLALLAFILWLTIVGANYPSELLGRVLFWVQDRLSDLFHSMHAPDWLHGVVVLGMYRTLAWVTSVMLPPMAIFFPLFTLLEDSGYLPRIAYNLDRPFCRCRACGKQSLTMCMGFGCNAAGVVGCRIIDSRRERLLAILTNNFVPCNGRLPTLIAMISMFFVGASGLGGSLLSALGLTAVILLGIVMTFATTSLLSHTVLKGEPSSFTLELPPYRRPQIGQVIVRSVFDRTLFVLGRAASIAAPAGVVIWLFAYVTIDGTSILSHCCALLDPIGKLMGLDGAILLAFILGSPANEIVIPMILMAYMSSGSLGAVPALDGLHALLVENGWTWTTAVSMMLFSLMHWPCLTTLMTIKKETGSAKWTVLAAVLPTAIGVTLCIILNIFVKYI